MKNESVRDCPQVTHWWVTVVLALGGFFLLFFLFGGRGSLYDAEIEATVRAVKQIREPFTLAVYTDIHYDPKNEVEPLDDTMECMKALLARCDIEAVWNLGDLINGHRTTKAEAIGQIREVLKKEEAVTGDVHRIQGNHDNNIQSTYEETAGYPMTEVLTNEELNAVLENKSTTQTEHHSGLRPTDYYVDFPEHQIRVVCITAEYTTFMPETAEWLSTTALRTDYAVLVLAHCPTRPEWGFKGDIVNGEQIEAELQAFVDRGGTVIAYIHGHDHGDMIENAQAWTGVAIGCARFQVPTSNGTPGMTYPDRRAEDATKVLFDVVCVDRENRRVHFIRVGAGQDRVIEY